MENYIFSHPKQKHAFLLFFLIILNLSACLRFYNLDVRPIHHDEGNNGLWALNIKEKVPRSMGPGGRHGPLPHFLNAFAFYLFGDNDFSLRLFAALCGVGLIAMVYPFRELMSEIGTLGSLLLLGLSPLMIYFSRFAINEIFLVFFTLILALALYRWILEGKQNYFLLAAGAWALMVATKETWIINLMALVAALIITFYLHRKELPPLRTNLRLNLKILGGGIILSLLLLIGFYTSFFTKFRDLRSLYQYHSFWISYGLKGEDHVYPFATYLTHLSLWELSSLLLAAIGLLLWLRFRDRWGTYLSFWTLFTLLAYSLIDYKTPWLITNILLPLSLLAGYSLKYLLDFSLKTKKLIPLISLLLIGCFAFSLWKAVELNYRRYDDSNLWVVYSQEFRYIRGLYKRIYQVARAQENSKQTEINIFLSDDHRSPTDWYLRRFPGKILYKNQSQITQADMLLFSNGTETLVTTKINPEAYEKGSVRSVGGVFHLWVKKEVWVNFVKKNPAPKG